MTPFVATPPSSGSDPNAQKFLTFHLGGERYGIPILRIREIVGAAPTTPLPRSPSHVRGVMNLRGRIIPVIDLRIRFGLPASEAQDSDGRSGCVIVLESIDGAGDCVLTGMAVDSVHEVTDIPSAAIAPPPTFGHATPYAFMTGLSTTRDRVVVLLAIDQILSSDAPDVARAA